MCLSIPSKVVKVSEDETMCTVDTMGVKRDASLLMMIGEEINIGDYVLLHIGFVMNKINDQEALIALDTYKEILESMNEEDRQRAILEDDECPSRSEELRVKSEE